MPLVLPSCANAGSHRSEQLHRPSCSTSDVKRTPAPLGRLAGCDESRGRAPEDHRKGAASSTSRAAGASVTSATCKPESRRNLKPTKPAIEISDADRKRKILITDKCTMTFKKWREKGESFRVDRYRCNEGRRLSLSISNHVHNKQGYENEDRAQAGNVSDLKHDLDCGFVELGGSVSVS
jgi:hypothetical protein